MKTRLPEYDPEAPIIVIDIGNTTTGVATWQMDRLITPLSVATGENAAFDEAFTAHLDALAPAKPAAVVIGSVVPKALKKACSYVSERLDCDALVVGTTIPLPMDVGVDDAKAIGGGRGI